MSVSESWPADKVERWPTDRLVPYVRNARTHSDAQIAQIAGSIREWGWTMPVLADEAGGLIAGHCRVLAARKLGLTEIPVMVANGWTEAQKRAYVIADNKLTLNAGWDADTSLPATAHARSGLSSFRWSDTNAESKVVEFAYKLPDQRGKRGG